MCIRDSGIPDLLNAGTDYENQVNLDGGIASSKYGIEEELGGTNTTLFQIGDQIYDGSPNQLVATVQSAGALGDGDAHVSTAMITIEYISASLFNVPDAGGEEVVTGQTSGIAATTTARRLGPKTGQYYLDVKSIQSNDPTYKFAAGETLQGNTSGAQAKIIAIEYNKFLRNEGEY